jgi:hypothetical protein
MSARELLTSVVLDHPETSRELAAALQGAPADLNEKDATTVSLIENAEWC